jgi:hypothetical protein
MQNAKCEMQNAKRKTQKEIERTETVLHFAF